MPDLRMLRRFAIYAGVGAVGTGVQYAILIATVRAGWATPVTGSTIGATVGAVVNYWLNRRVTFRNTSSHLSTVPKFAAIALLGMLVNGLLMKVFTASLELPYLIAQVLATAIVLAMNYLINSAWTFNEHGPGTPRPDAVRPPDERAASCAPKQSYELGSDNNTA